MKTNELPHRLQALQIAANQNKKSFLPLCTSVQYLNYLWFTSKKFDKDTCSIPQMSLIMSRFSSTASCKLYRETSKVDDC